MSDSGFGSDVLPLARGCSTEGRFIGGSAFERNPVQLSVLRPPPETTVLTFLVRGSSSALALS